MLRRILFAISLSLSFVSIAVQAQTKINIGVSPAGSWSIAFIAADQGYFTKHNLDAAITIVAVNPQIMPAIVAGSLDIGGITPAGMVQAVAGDIDFVALAGGVVSDKKDTSLPTGTGALVRPAMKIGSPQDFVGKKIGVPGLGSGLDIEFRMWLKEHGVDYRKVNFVEVGFPQQSDDLKSNAVDGVISIDPFLSRILDAKTGTLAFDFLREQDAGILAGVYVATRNWTDAHPHAARDFRQALNEAYDFQLAHPQEARTIVAKFLKLPPQAVSGITLFTMERNVTPAQLKFWVDAMKEQSWILKAPDTSTLVFH